MDVQMQTTFSRNLQIITLGIFGLLRLYGPGIPLILLVLESILSISVVHWMYSITLCIGCLGIPVESTCVEALVLLFKRVCWLQWVHDSIFFACIILISFVADSSQNWCCCHYKVCPSHGFLCLFISCIMNFDLWRYTWWCMEWHMEG